MIYQPKNMAPHRPALSELSERSREVFRHIVDSYLETGEPVGSRNLAKRLGNELSPATIRNVMADLEEVGLLFAPHISAGRLPTEWGLKLFVDGLMEVGGLTKEEQQTIESQCSALGRSPQEMLSQASGMLSGLARCASLVVAPKTDRPLKHIEFVALSPGRTLVILVTEGGVVENRLIETPISLPTSVLIEATNYLNARLFGRSLSFARTSLMEELRSDRAALDDLTKKVVEAGLASWGDQAHQSALIVRGQSALLEDVTQLADLERLRALFAALEAKENVMKLLEKAEGAEGVQIFIGTDNELFDIAGCSAVISPYRDRDRQLIGAIGVIGPSRINYARIIPMVDYTAKVIGRLLG